VAAAAAAHVVHVLGEVPEDRAHAIEGAGVAARHDRQRALLGRGRSARDAGVDVGDVAGGEALVDRARRARRGGAEVDDHVAGARGVVERVDHRLDHATVGQREQDRVGARRDLGRRVRGLDPDRLCPRRVGVVADDRLAAVDDPAGDAPAHVAQADDADHGILTANSWSRRG
jgi:hypothetical protein